ncbi:hypothetical protein [Bradyrhizobium sp. STM 3557]|uniref:hypothetical protein n=1 Tax=Bradyrhizobium sp. STM 3557 TaxID=578920 RepID=UPI00388F3658
MMILRCAMLLAAALTLSNCCLSSSGCNGPLALNTAPSPAAAAVAAAPGAWDGLSEQPAADTDATVDVTSPKKQPRRSRTASVDAMSSQSARGSRADLSWDEQQAADRADDARLRQKLIICKNCSASQ